MSLSSRSNLNRHLRDQHDPDPEARVLRCIYFNCKYTSYRTHDLRKHQQTCRYRPPPMLFTESSDTSPQKHTADSSSTATSSVTSRTYWRANIVKKRPLGSTAAPRPKKSRHETNSEPRPHRRSPVIPNLLSSTAPIRSRIPKKSRHEHGKKSPSQTPATASLASCYYCCYYYRCCSCSHCRRPH